MTIYYILPQNSNEQIALDATQTVQLDETGKTTTLPLETGEEVTDHYINGNTKVSMAGVISTAKSAGNITNRSPESYINAIRELKKSGQPFSIHFSDKINPLTNCVFESLSISQSVRNGTRVSNGSSSYKVTFSVKQVRIIKAAQVAVERDSRVVDSFSDKEVTGKSTQPPKDERNLLQRKSEANLAASTLLFEAT
jgi:hypothetical protein